MPSTHDVLHDWEDMCVSSCFTRSDSEGSFGIGTVLTSQSLGQFPWSTRAENHSLVSMSSVFFSIHQFVRKNFHLQRNRSIFIAHRSCLDETHSYLLHGPQGEPQSATPRHSGPFGRLAIQSPLTGYEPNSTLDVISTEHTPNPT